MKKAFTLVELLGVIIILGVLALIVFPIVDKSIKQGKEKALQSTINSIEDAANKYSVEHELGYSTNYNKLDLNELVNNGYLKDDLINPVTNSKLNGCVLYKWDEEYNQYEFKYEDPCPSYPEIPASLISILLEQYSEGNSTGLVKDSTNENLYYYTGTNEEVSNNFLWYGGHQWRVLEFDTSANTLTLITQQPLTAISPVSAVWESQEAYESSYINTWLNEYFWNSLDSSIQNNVLDSTFNIGIYTDVDEITTTEKVGLLDAKQYKRAGEAYSFLDIKNSFELGNRYDSTLHGYVTVNGEVGGALTSNTLGVRAVIKISDIIITEGDGSLASSYRTANKAVNINEVQVGEYINVPYSGSDNACGDNNMCAFRVVSRDNDSVKVVLNGLLPDTSTYGSSTTISTSHTIYTSLNKFAEGISDTYRYTGNKTFYIGDYSLGSNYKDVQDEMLEAGIGLPTVGEMFSGNDIDLSTSSDKTFVDVNTIENPTVSIYYWTMNRNNSSFTGIVEYRGSFNGALTSNTLGVRPAIYLKSGLNFTGGKGTAQSPYSLQ